MGLGKTLQTICIVAGDHHSKATAYKVLNPQRRCSLLLSLPRTISISVLLAIFRKLVFFSFPVNIKCNVTFHRFFPRKLETVIVNHFPLSWFALLLLPATGFTKWRSSSAKIFSNRFIIPAHQQRGKGECVSFKEHMTRTQFFVSKEISTQNSKLKIWENSDKTTRIYDRLKLPIFSSKFGPFRCLKRHTTLGRRYMKSLAFFLLKETQGSSYWLEKGLCELTKQSWTGKKTKQ